MNYIISLLGVRQMNDKIVFGQYIYRNSIVHKLDPRVKLGILFIMMIGTFLIPKDNFFLLGIAFLIPLLAVIFSKISLFKYLKSLKQIAFVMIFSFVFQLFASPSGRIVITFPIHLTYINIIIGILILVVYFIVRKYLPFKLLFLILICLFILSLRKN